MTHPGERIIIIGIGGSILQLEERSKDLWEAVPHIPLDRILIETDKFLNMLFGYGETVYTHNAYQFDDYS